MKIDDRCEWLHRQLGKMELVKYPFEMECLPKNGIYFFYEEGEEWGHEDSRPRIVRVGTHKKDNFRKRINEHYLIKDVWMNFDSSKPAPKDRSIFRKNLGRVILYRENPGYLPIWNISFMERKNKAKYSHKRDIEFEKEMENRITRILREKFTFRYIEIEDEGDRLGEAGLESKLIGLVAQCSLCKPSVSWLGNDSPVEKIRKNGLWQVQHLTSKAFDDQDVSSLRF